MNQRLIISIQMAILGFLMLWRDNMSKVSSPFCNAFCSCFVSPFHATTRSGWPWQHQGLCALQARQTSELIWTFKSNSTCALFAARFRIEIKTGFLCPCHSLFSCCCFLSVRAIKSRNMRWVWHVARMAQIRNSHISAEDKKPFGIGLHRYGCDAWWILRKRDVCGVDSAASG
jgi:hypothetical protein